MLFNSYTFILLFLPATFAIFQGLRRLGWNRGAFAALVLASLVFYAWWSIRYLFLLLGLMLVNFLLARWLVDSHRAGRRGAALVLAAGLVFNLAVLGYYKYANFFVENLAGPVGLDWSLPAIVLPLGISFFTFQKIALLVDCYKGKVASLDPLEYSLFVVFFPQLIAGPIVHHSEVMPQFRVPRINGDIIVLGLAIFTIGLAKKVLFADNLALYASPVFDAAAAGKVVAFVSAWCGALAYTLQLYFDFSGYSDMAIGAALLFGVRLPLNFASPYQAASMIEFWRRWHMTLSRFLRDYLYFPLGGNRKGVRRRYVNLVATMVLGGIWHGAGWNFVLWGALHGFYLTVNHGWRTLTGETRNTIPGRALGTVLTFVAVVLGWVLFRASDFSAAVAMLRGMAGLSGSGDAIIDASKAASLIVPLLGIVWFLPNTQELTGYSPPGAVPATSPPRMLLPWAAALGGVFALAFLSLSKVSEFLYFQF
jgi:alginate O-acetyltransferase complex protein AlgI